MSAINRVRAQHGIPPLYPKFSYHQNQPLILVRVNDGGSKYKKLKRDETQGQYILTQCPKCKTRGFIHDSGLSHETDINEPCSLCQSCIVCNGKGKIVIQINSRPCYSCFGKGFFHDSRMIHNTPENQRCISCHNCHVCKSSCIL